MSITEKPEAVVIDGKGYKVKGGTYYEPNTPDKVIDWLEMSRVRGQRIRVFLGRDGKCFNEEYDTIGHVGRSTGSIKIPLLIFNSRSTGGPAMLSDSIVRIDTKDSSGKIVTVYCDPSIRFDHFISTDIGTVYNETRDELHSRCKNGDSGKRYAEFMNGERWSK